MIWGGFGQRICHAGCPRRPMNTMISYTKSDFSHEMNSPQRTACLAKDYINSARCLMATTQVLPIKEEVTWSLVTSLSIWGGGQDTENRRTHGQYAILSLASSQNLCQTMMIYSHGGFVRVTVKYFPISAFQSRMLSHRDAEFCSKGHIGL